MPRIHRCVCTNTSFAALLATARAHGLSLPQLADRTGASRHCGRCRPYLRRALRTGQVVFHQLLNDKDEPDTRALHVRQLPTSTVPTAQDASDPNT